MTARLGAAEQPRATGYDMAKRALDLCLVIPLIVLSAPIVALAACAVWIADPGPVFYSQPREGRGGRIFRMLKLRTMYRDADARLSRLLREDPSARAEWEARFKLHRDPRVLSGVGAFLRSSSIDELPQFLHVLTGEMSLVGPRPFPEYHLAALPPAFRARRRSVLPGVTGLWQVGARSDCDLAGQQRLDETYLDNRSLALDLRILAATPGSLLRGKGAY